MEKVIHKFPFFDKYIGFEPAPKLYKEAVRRFKNNKKVFINNLAVDINDGRKKLYISYHKNSRKLKFCPTLVKNKKKVKKLGSKSEFVYVKTINFSKYIIDNFKESDEIVLKIDIEGKEYDLLEHMINTGAIKYINKLYCDWHYDGMCEYTKWTRGKYKIKHYDFIDKLNKYGFNLTGDNLKDELEFLIDDMDRL